MHGFFRNEIGRVLALALTVLAGEARAENLRDAWAIALAINPQLQASRRDISVGGPGASVFARLRGFPRSRRSISRRS